MTGMVSHPGLPAMSQPLKIPAQPASPEWITTPGLTGYDEAVRFMEDRAEAIARGEARECIWLVEPPISIRISKHSGVLNKKRVSEQE